MSPPSEFSPWVPDGYQVKRVRRPRKDIPEWANDDLALKRRIVGPALRVWGICNRYFRVGLTAGEIAVELGTTEDAIRKTIYRVRRSVERKRARLS